MNFNSLFRVCLIFYTYDSANFKSIGNNTMKKMLLITALALLITGCAQQTSFFKQTGSSSTKGNHHPSFLRFWNWAEENCRCSQNLWRRRKWEEINRNPANIRKWIARFYYLGIYTPLEARVYCSQ